jgi:sporulation protein YlmC with PRC-barrel domain
MLQRLLFTTAIAALALTPALAQDSTTDGSATGTQPPVQTPSAPEPQAQDQTTPPTTTTPETQAQDQTTPPSSAPAEPPADVATETPATPPPADAIITAESATDMRADKLIGTSVYNTEGEEVGSVQDIVFDQDGKIVGVVLKVGGVLGIGGKSVGIKWDEVQISPTEELMTISYKKEQLEVAPDFKTQDAMKTESNNAMPEPQPVTPSSPTTTQ